ncbi:MAG: Hpt domain-containing protein [Paracoccaceae bacterium]
MPTNFATFFEECEELLEAMHDGFDRMAADMHDAETMHAIFRAVHSIKGGAGAFRLDQVVAFAHHFETSLDKVRSGQVDADDEMLELFRQCGDHLSDLVEAARDDETATLPGSNALRERLSEAVGEDPDQGPEELPEFEPVALSFDFDGEDDDAPGGYDLTFRAEPGLFATGNEPALLFQALERFGPVTVLADLDDVPPLDALAPENCAVTWTLSLDTDAPEADLREVFDFVEGDCHLEITRVAGLPGPASPIFPTSSCRTSP